MSSTTGKGDALCRYYTPDRLAAAVVGELVSNDIVSVHHDAFLEPHAGGGAWVRALEAHGANVYAMDIDPASPWDHRDFLQYGHLTGWIVGNPPFTDAEAHVRYALDHARKGVVFLLRLAFLASKKRMWLFAQHPPSEVWILSERPSFTGGGTDSTDYAIFVWIHDRQGPPVIRWLEWR